MPLEQPSVVDYISNMFGVDPGYWTGKSAIHVSKVHLSNIRYTDKESVRHLLKTHLSLQALISQTPFTPMVSESEYVQLMMHSLQVYSRLGVLDLTKDRTKNPITGNVFYNLGTRSNVLVSARCFDHKNSATVRYRYTLLNSLDEKNQQEEIAKLKEEIAITLASINFNQPNTTTVKTDQLEKELIIIEE